MKTLIKTLTLLALMHLMQSINAQEITCNLKGTIIGRDSQTLILIPVTEDPRFNGIKIPIIDNHFEYELSAPVIEMYHLIFEDELQKGMYQPVAFFPDSTTIEFVLHTTEEFDKNFISGGELNKKNEAFEKERIQLFYAQYTKIEKLVDSLYSEGKYFSEAASELMEKIRNTQDPEERSNLLLEYREFSLTQEAYTPEGLKLNYTSDSLSKAVDDWQNNYIKSNRDILSYYLLRISLERFNQNNDIVDIGFITEIYPEFSKDFPSHPYTYQIGEMLNAINTLHVGSRFIDFTAPTIDGNPVTISEEVKGKVALIDLWASWCGPCRALSKSIIPIYEKYKDKGFVVIGVACEYKNTKSFMMALENDKYPWMNLIELDNANGIWSKYNIAGSGGCTYLIDNDGTIIAVHPTAEELENLLTDLLE